MASISALEKRALEKIMGMSSGYVLDFSNRTFYEFVEDVVRRDIDDPRYDNASNSKANRLRAFWSVEPDHIVAELLNALLQVAERDHQPDPTLLDECRRIATRLREVAPVSDLDALEPNADGRDFDVLARSVRDSISANEPEAGLDRLHTFVFRYIRVLAEREGLDVPVGKALHSVFGELVKALRRRGAIESQMAERILKSAISTLDSFNDVRNNRSFAHGGPLLGYEEALLIFNHVASVIRFLRQVTGDRVAAELPAPEADELPF